MLTYEQVRDWARVKYGPRHAERRITDIGYAYSVNTQPDAYLDGDTSAMTYGNGPDLVVKRTGAVWQFGSAPTFMALYEVRSEDELRRAMAALLPQCDPDRPQESVPAPQTPPPHPPANAYPVAPPQYPPATAYPAAPAPAPYPPVGAYPAGAAPYPPAGTYPAGVSAYPVAPEMPEFVAADAHHAVLVDATGVSFDQRDVVTDFLWQDVQAVHHTVRGLCLLVGVTHRNGMFYECRVGGSRQKRLREWSRQLAQVLGHYRGGPGG
ncbi:hypothetical protein [Streptomyces sp. NPDC003023]|uniref:hypothetical protein n=1 Tax=Streptomyces sp. NPDC003023 TaxID=3364675 RepID=UPI0036791C52